MSLRSLSLLGENGKIFTKREFVRPSVLNVANKVKGAMRKQVFAACNRCVYLYVGGGNRPCFDLVKVVGYFLQPNVNQHLDEGRHIVTNNMI